MLSWLLYSKLAGMVRIRIGEDPSTVTDALGTVPVLAAVTSPPTLPPCAGCHRWM
ncbi:hypothetical protein G7085_11695 [Tessaracoccus sp. HDW20]|uniref:hypothetical protein n=1 Tax=Tessaracoccus coleopterorum TaxID=2714950 RepID=UPI0018D2ABC3|nr:hypothetical protein [Tessaracoccus coleopterorum]NHB85051.1 hypothetical protein [Tessaracoccus coleopterorum]